jgi:hypothetical protein
MQQISTKITTSEVILLNFAGFKKLKNTFKIFLCAGFGCRTLC